VIKTPLRTFPTPPTTGLSKGACLAHEPTTRAANCIAERLRLSHRDISPGPTALSSSFQQMGNLTLSSLLKIIADIFEERAKMKIRN
jgi:hypothetical protein